MSRARMKLEPGERLLLASRPHPAALLPAALRALGALLAAATVMALLARSSAPHPVRLSLDLLALALAARAVLRFARSVWQ
ncbi:MAG: thiol reductant ABC exporter subunit CydC, partial [Actinomycetota bacterium]|nr:thiol reductant ABC exporter subunit CydC [Actinomycetota bacterium]